VSDSIAVEEARRLIAGGDAKAVDLRDDDDWREARIAGAIRVDDGGLDDALEDVDDGVKLIVIGPDQKAAQVADQLSERGREAVLIEGGIDAWKSEDYPLQPSPDPEDGTPV
jgi:rhodanese-related sulfurtransferase